MDSFVETTSTWVKLHAKLAASPSKLQTIWLGAVAALGETDEDGRAIWQRDTAIAAGEVKAGTTIAALREARAAAEAASMAEKAAAKKAKEAKQEQHAILTRFHASEAVDATKTKAKIDKILTERVLAESAFTALCVKLKERYEVLSPSSSSRRPCLL